MGIRDIPAAKYMLLACTPPTNMCGFAYNIVSYYYKLYIDGLVQERHNSSANALELRLSCTNPWVWWDGKYW